MILFMQVLKKTNCKKPYNCIRNKNDRDKRTVKFKNKLN